MIIRDGWGYNPNPSEDKYNAIKCANTPTDDMLMSQYPNCLIHTSGEDVGLPDGTMGNSEVGHQNIGAGRIVFQDFTRVSQAVEDGSIADNPVLLKAIAASRENASTLHVMGLLSPGGVHSHEDHFMAVVRMAADAGAQRVCVHGFLDGRDTPPRSAGASIERMQTCVDALDNASFATLCGRYYAMDRDQRWDRNLQAWDMLVEARAEYHADKAAAGLEAAYARDENDELRRERDAWKATALDESTWPNLTRRRAQSRIEQKDDR